MILGNFLCINGFGGKHERLVLNLTQNQPWLRLLKDLVAPKRAVVRWGGVPSV